MQIGWIIFGAILLAALGVWWFVLWRQGIRTPPSGKDPDDFRGNNII